MFIQHSNIYLYSDYIFICAGRYQAVSYLHCLHTSFILKPYGICQVSILDP
jgi:hypothetical protein